MRHRKTQQNDADSCTTRHLVGLRMPQPEFEECRQLANAEERSIAQFALKMYRQGLAAYKQTQKKNRGGA